MQGHQTTIPEDIERSVHLKSGETIHYDYRSESLKRDINYSNNTRPLKIIQWNIERGIKLDGIITQLREHEADIIALQEIDSGDSRSEFIDTGVAIAKELGLQYVFQNEFIELESEIDKRYYYTQILDPHLSQSLTDSTIDRLKRDDNNSNRVITRDDPNYQVKYKKSTIISTTQKHNTMIQYHPTPVPTSSTYKYGQYAVRSEMDGVHGNCILTKFDISRIISLQHRHHPYNWSRDGGLLNEPRIGERQTLCVVINVPKRYIAAKLPTQINQDELLYVPPVENVPNTPEYIQVPVYTCHLELFCGLTDRLKILGEIFAHFRREFYDGEKEKGKKNQNCDFEQFTAQNKNQKYGLILGDFNTLAHSIARFSGKYCKDSLRWKSIGYSEAEWWYKYVLDTTQYRSDYYKTIESGQNTIKTPLSSLKLPNMTDEDVLNLVNPGFCEPFDPQTETLTNYSGWFYGKLDWMLTMGFYTINTDLFNLDYSDSDHRGMILEGFFAGDSEHFLKMNKSGDEQKIGDKNGEKVQNKLPFVNPLTLIEPTTELPLVPKKPVIPHHLQHCFIPRTYLICPQNNPQNNSNKIHQNDQNDHFEKHFQLQIFSKNSHFFIYPIVKNFIDNYHDESQGFHGHLRRNCTPYVQQVMTFAIPTMLAFVYLLLSTQFE
jgi:hypothetical protein